MNARGRMIWLASYPKSGNTWLRIVLSHLLARPGQTVDLDNLPPQVQGAAGRPLFDEATGLFSADLQPGEIERLRPWTFEYWADRAGEPLFPKVHDCWRRTVEGVPVFPPAISAGVVYLVRNPLDVAVSFGRQLGWAPERTIAFMGHEGAALAGDAWQLPQWLSSWSGHVRSWRDNGLIPVHLVRYEDMKAQPLETFSRIAAFCGLEAAPERVAQAVEAARFERLQAREAAQGFGERVSAHARFFQSGETGGWKSVLTRAEVDRLRADHGAVMASLGYSPPAP